MKDIKVPAIPEGVELKVFAEAYAEFLNRHVKDVIAAVFNRNMQAKKSRRPNFIGNTPAPVAGKDLAYLLNVSASTISRLIEMRQDVLPKLALLANALSIDMDEFIPDEDNAFVSTIQIVVRKVTGIDHAYEVIEDAVFSYLDGDNTEALEILLRKAD